MAALSTVAKQSGGGHSDDVHSVAVERIKIVPGFNYRDLTTPDARAKIRAMADDMLDPYIGFLQKKVLIVRMAGEEIHLVDDHRRMEAVWLANAEGAGITTVPCMTEERGTTDLERDYELFMTGEPLTIQEKAVGVKRQRNRGQSFADIARRLRVTVPTIKSWLEVAGAPQEIIEAVNHDKIAPTEALKVARKHGDEAGLVIKRAVEHARARGKSRATGQDVAAVTKPRTEPVSLCSLAMAAVLAWREYNDGTGPGGRQEFEAALDALEQHLGPLAVRKAA